MVFIYILTKHIKMWVFYILWPSWLKTNMRSGVLIDVLCIQAHELKVKCLRCRSVERDVLSTFKLTELVTYTLSHLNK